MCGIAGFVGRNFTRQQLDKMTGILQHRGPDAEGFYFDEIAGVGLGHRRLSVLDLSSLANQPFRSRGGRYMMVYNGEVYNFKEVAAQFGIETITTSDTEVIIEAFAKKGVEAINALNGMFSIAIWDETEKKLFLFRDRVGVKPLYYCLDNGAIAFASELKALFTLPFPKEINQSAIADFLYLGYIPGENTIYTTYKKLKPGHYLVFDKERAAIDSYWRPEDKIEPDVLADESLAKKKLKELVFSSVELSMISDVPLGVFLSGGIDSSLVASVAQAISSSPVKTFSIGFRENKYNESPYARQVASLIKSDHTEFIVNHDDAIELIDGLTGIYDEPYADPSAIPTLLVSQLARKQVTVALSGDGGDELFWGYGFYFWARRLNRLPVKMFRKAIRSGLYNFGDNRMKRASFMFDYKPERIKSHIFSQEQYYFTEREINELLLIPADLSIDEDIISCQRRLDVIEQQSLFDIKNYLPEELLVKTDRASMHHALEVRVPLLDYRLVEFALNLSPDLKLRGNTGKYLLKQVLYDLLPKEIFDRPKWGFAIPLQYWLSHELRFLLDKYLSESIVEGCGLVNNSKVQYIKQQFLTGKSYLYNRLWALIQLHKWYTENVLKNSMIFDNTNETLVRL